MPYDLLLYTTVPIDVHLRRIQRLGYLMLNVEVVSATYSNAVFQIEGVPCTQLPAFQHIVVLHCEFLPFNWFLILKHEYESLFS